MKPDGATNKLLKLCTVAALAAAPVNSTFAQAKPAAKKPAAAPAPAKPITEAKKEDFRVAVTLPAIFEATRLTPVKVEPKAWTDLTIKTIVPHGTPVKKGSRLVELDLEALEKQVEGLEEAQKTSKLMLQNTLDGLAQLEETTPLQLEAANRALRQANEDFDRWIKSGRTRAEESYKRNLASSKRSLEYAQEELNQLQKMYDEDDLTEETEEIILKRAKIGVEQAEYFLERAQESHDHAMKIGIPRQHQAAVDAHRQAKLTHDLAVRTIPRGLELKRLEAAKAKDDAAKAAEKLSDLRRDLATLKEIKAPVDGVAYYGRSIRGVWTSAEAAKKLIPNGKLAPKVQFMTIVGDGPLQAQTSIPEDKLAILKPGAKGHLTPTSNPLVKIPATLGKINYASSPVGFKTAVRLDLPEKSNLMAGMKGNLTFNVADRKGVITIPVTAVSKEGNKAYVFVPKEDGENEKREVRLAETDGKKVAVLKGLAEKEKVLTVAP